MDENKPISVDITNKKVVYAIPAKPKPPKPWYINNFGWLMVIWYCVAMMAMVWVE